MSTLTVNGSAVKKMTLKDSSGTEQKVKKWYHDDVKVFSSGNICTYYVDTNDVHSEEIDGEESCLSPKTFTPTKSGWIFVGWRENNTASSEVLSSKLMGEDPINLYAVFKQYTTTTGTTFYNNGNTMNHSVVYICNGVTYIEEVNKGDSCLSPKTFTPSLSGATFKGWSESKTSTTVVSSKVMADQCVTLYAVWKYNDMSPSVASGSKGSGDCHLSYGTTQTFVTGIDTSKYESITISINARAWQNYQSSYYAASMRANFCGNDQLLFWAGDDGDTETYSSYQTWTLGSGSSVYTYMSQAHDSTGGYWVSMGNATLHGRTIVK